MDLDILYYDDLQLETPKLVLPHPRMKERGFVLAPLSTIRPERVDPDILASVADGVTLWKEEW
jgi:2-amino-4-hydroxy-6-hydroxymethyldihydropteridine diphosphokinase